MALHVGRLLVVGIYDGDANCGQVALVHGSTNVLRNTEIRASVDSGLSTLIGRDVAAHAHRFLRVQSWMLGVRSEGGGLHTTNVGVALRTTLTCVLIMLLAVLVPVGRRGVAAESRVAQEISRLILVGMFVRRWLCAVAFLAHYPKTRGPLRAAGDAGARVWRIAAPGACQTLPKGGTRQGLIGDGSYRRDVT